MLCMTDELKKAERFSKYDFFSHLFSHMWPRNRLCADLTEQALRTCLGLPRPKLVLSWLTVAIGHISQLSESLGKVKGQQTFHQKQTIALWIN